MKDLLMTSSSHSSDASVEADAPRLLFKKCCLILGTVLPEVLIHHMLTPLYPYITLTFLDASQLEDLAYHTGMIQSAYFFPSTLLNSFWGHTSDKYGKRNTLMMCLVGYGTATLMLGLSTSLKSVMLSLVAMGCFAGNTSVAKGMIGEMVKNIKRRKDAVMKPEAKLKEPVYDSRLLSKAYSLYGLVFGITAIMGSLLGGILTSSSADKNDARRNPDEFAQLPFIEKYPYFMACLTGFILAIIGLLMTWLYLPKDRVQFRSKAPPKEKMDGSNDEHVPLTTKDVSDVLQSQVHLSTPLSVSLNSVSPVLHSRSSSHSSALDYSAPHAPVQKPASLPLRILILLTRRHTLTPLLCYASYALSSAMFNSSLPLLASTPSHEGGYGVESTVTASIITTCNMTKLVAKSTFWLLHAVLKGNTKYCYRLGVLFAFPAYLLATTKWYDGSQVTLSTLYVSASLSGISEGFTYLSIITLMSEQVAGEAQMYGLMHGMGGTVAAFARTLGPYLVGVCWQHLHNTVSPLVAFSPATLVFRWAIFIASFGLACSFL